MPTRGFTRRRFIKTSALVGAGFALAGRRVLGQALPPRWELRKFVAPLPGIGAAGIPLGVPDKKLYNQTGAQADYYRIFMGQYSQSFHPDLPGSRLWGYADGTQGVARFRYLGPAIVATKGTPVRISFVNQLPPHHPLPVDTTIPGAETTQLVNRAAVHLHGGFVPWMSDGGPFHWKAANGTRGPSLIDWLPDKLGRLTDDYWYPNDQSARLLWYHDHAVGITRLNAYAGLAAPYVLIDNSELAMFGAGGVLLPGQLPGIPLVLQDKSFKAAADQFGKVGDLDYPYQYGEQESEPGGYPNQLPEISAVPEFFADNIVINGMAYPEVTLAAGAHRFRMLNGTQSRVFNLQLYQEDPGNPGEIHEVPQKGPDFVVIGTEGGFLPSAAVIPSNGVFDLASYYAHDRLSTSQTPGYGLVLAGAERADVLIDFTGCAGSTYILYNDAGSPFPDGGDTDLDYHIGNLGARGGAPRPGFGPNTRTMMRIRITAQPGQAMPSPEAINLALGGVALGLVVPPELLGDNFVPPSGTVARNKTLNEGVDAYGRLIAMLGTDFETGTNFTKHGTRYEEPIDEGRENYQAGTQADPSYEVWDIYNTTGDTHPIHFHLVNVQVIGRVAFSANLDGSPIFLAPTRGWALPDSDERGWKETVRMDPGQITRVFMKIELPPDPVVNVRGNNVIVPIPKSPRTGDLEYVWHCHILEHEEHDMMRPFVVK